jgi:hypothetical protein
LIPTKEYDPRKKRVLIKLSLKAINYSQWRCCWVQELLGPVGPLAELHNWIEQQMSAATYSVGPSTVGWTSAILATPGFFTDVETPSEVDLVLSPNTPNAVNSGNDVARTPTVVSLELSPLSPTSRPTIIYRHQRKSI